MILHSIRHFVLLFLLFFGVNLKSQNYFPYYESYNNIEEIIVKEEFQKADSLFEKLFIDYEPPFANHVLVALQISILAENYEHSKELFEKAIIKGVQLHCLKEIGVIEKVPNKIMSYIELNYYKLRQQYINNIDTALRKIIYIRYKYEQANKRDQNLKYGIFEKNTLLLKEFCNEKGYFPGEKHIGINGSIDLYAVDNCHIESTYAHMTLLHYSCPFSTLEEELYEALKRGEIYPRVFGRIYNYEKYCKIKSKGRYANPYFYTKQLPKYDFNLFAYRFRNSDIDKVNADRKRFGIGKYENDAKIKKIEEKYNIRIRFVKG